MKIRVPSWLSSSSNVPQISLCPRAPAWRLPRLRPENPASFPWRVARDRLETRLGGDRAAHAIQQSIFGMLLLVRQSAELSSGPRSTIAAARVALPFACIACQVRSRIYSPRPPHLPRAKFADAFLPPQRCGSCPPRALVNRRCESSRTTAVPGESCFFGDGRRNASASRREALGFSAVFPARDSHRTKSAQPLLPRAPFQLDGSS